MRKFTANPSILMIKVPLSIFNAVLAIFLMSSCNNDVPCPSDDCSDSSFTEAQPYRTDKDLSGLLSRRLVDNGLLAAGNQCTYESGDFDSQELTDDIRSDLIAGGLSSDEILDKLSILSDEEFQIEVCGNDPCIARMLLGSYKENTIENQFVNGLKDYILNNATVRFEGDSEIPNILGFNPNLDGNSFYMTNYRQFQLIVVSRQLDGASGQTVGPIWNNESVDLQDDNGTNNIEQINLDAITAYEHLKNWNNQAVIEDKSVVGLEVNDLIARISLSGSKSTPEREALLERINVDGEIEQLYLIAPGSKPAREVQNGIQRLSMANFLDERILYANDNFDPTSSDINQTRVAGDIEIEYYQGVTGKILEDRIMSYNSYIQIFDSIEEMIDTDQSFQENVELKYGPIESAR